MFQIEVLLSPALLPYHQVQNKHVIVVDILRATSTIVTAINEGASHVKTVLNSEEAAELKGEGYLSAGERNGAKMEGFDMGNSPFECMEGKVLNQKLALTTTNGTKCFNAAQEAGAQTILAGSFLNLDATVDWLINHPADCIVLCAGWKNKVNLEDTLYAGLLTQRLIDSNVATTEDDGALMAMDILQMAGSDFADYLKKSSHYQRLSHLHHHEDMVYCLKQSTIEVVVGMKDNVLVKFL